MDYDSIADQLAAVDDGASRAQLFDSLCGNNQTARQAVAELLRQRDVSVHPEELPTKPPTAGQTLIRSPNPIGQRLGHYEIVEQLGEGGMGVVYLAKQEQPVKREVAIKVTKPGFESHELLARFQAERQALALMDHENIAKVFDAGATEDGRLYFVMELVRGTAITHFCDDARLNTHERLQLFIAVCRAIQHAHQKGVVHRDVKPSNVLIVEVDGQPVPKVIDFGLAKALEQQLAPQTLHTQYGQVLGTLEYMSPEQASFTSVDIDTRSDVYSLGVLLYELLTGSTPVGRGRLQQLELDELLRIIRDEDPERPSTRLSSPAADAGELSGLRNSDPTRLRDEFRGDLDLIALKALAKDRERRYDSPAALAADVQRFLSHEPIEARAPSAVYLLGKFARRNRALVVGLAGVFTALAFGIGFSTYFAISARRAAQLASRQTEVAQKQRDFAIATLQDVVFQIQMPLAEIPAAREVRKEMLDSAIRGVKRMTEQFGEEWDSSRVMMIALEDIGDMFLNLGPSADEALEMDHRLFAEQQFLRAKEIADRHIKQWPGDALAQFDLHYVYTRLAIVDQSLGRWEAAVDKMLISLPYIEGIVDSNPQQYTGTLFNTYFGLSGMCFTAGQLDEAIRWTEAGIQVANDSSSRGLELAEPIDERALEELRVRAATFELLPDVYEDMTVAFSQPSAVRNRLLIDRAKYFLQAEQLTKVNESLEALLEGDALRGADYYGAACRYTSLALATVGEVPVEQASAEAAASYESYCAKAVELLNAALDTDYFDSAWISLSLINRDGDLDPLRNRDDFKAFVAELERKSE